MPDEFGEKTEEPTERRRSEARRKGNVARSTDLNAAGLMLAVALVLYFFMERFSQSMGELMQAYLSAPAWRQLDSQLVSQQIWDLARFLLVSVLPILLFMMTTALLLNIVQVGFLAAPEVLQFKWNRVNPVEGAKRIVSIRSLVKLAVSLGKLTILVAIASWWITTELPSLLLLSEAEASRMTWAIGRSLAGLALSLALALILLAMLDFAFQKWKHEEDLKMSKQEVRDEMKQMEGDPHIRHRRREAHRKLAQARELGQVQHADVVITNPTHIAIAIKYDPETMPAPMVVAKGMGVIAERIRRLAIEHQVPIIERKPLARALYRDVKVGEPIPVEMYEVFVEIMAYIYQISGRTPPKLA